MRIFGVAMKQVFPIPVIALFLVAAILAAGCTSGTNAPAPGSPGDTLFAQGSQAFNNSNFPAATGLFALAKENYSAAGDKAGFIRARDMEFMSIGAGNDFPYNRSEIEAAMAQAFPGATAAQRDAWLDAPMTATLESETGIWYFYDTIHNIKNHNPALLREENARAGHTPLYDELMPVITAPWENGTGTYGAPVAYTGSTNLNIPRTELPADGTLKAWMPVPVATGSQTNVTILSAEPSQYMKSSTGTDADIGLVYFEIPLEEATGPFVNLSVQYRFVQHEQRFVVDPATVLPYDTGSPEYRKYTASSRNVAVTPEITAKALSIVGNETNPYLQAQKIYWDVVSTHPYSHAPHFWIEASQNSESQYVLETGIGDCGTQSMYFAALCRAIGIPARATGGYQMITGSPGTHIWAEYYLEGYGWIPVDVTAAEGGDASYNATPGELEEYKTYFFGSLDPYRFVIQKSLDLPLVPGSGDAVVPPVGWVQVPKLVCDTCTENPMALSFTYSKVAVAKE